mmetsp:Transcript_31161/g.53732  ORF Transcript_31161/g.53732 Transcript_31161/m.53732 type:complete len:170 (+) Transcript_31161:453-962(+)
MTSSRRAITPDSFTFAALIDACRYSGQTVKALEIFHSMADYGVHPNEQILQRIVLVVNDCRLKGEAHTIDPAAFADYDARRTIEAILASPTERDEEARQAVQRICSINVETRAGRLVSSGRLRHSGKAEAKSSENLCLRGGLAVERGPRKQEEEEEGEGTRQFIRPVLR